jgi:hypothetical protein
MSGEEPLEFELVVNDGSLSSTADAVAINVAAASAAAANGFLTSAAAAVSEGRFTLNNRWTLAELIDQGISTDFAYDNVVNDHPFDRYRAFTTLVSSYKARLRQCQEDYNQTYAPATYDSLLVTYHFQDRKCYPSLERANDLQETVSYATDELAQQALQRYGYYCGGGYPNYGDVFGADRPEPLDGVDYCCRLHDAQAWNARTTGGTCNPVVKGPDECPNECGIAMCLTKLSEYPAGTFAQFPAIDESRQHWYGQGATGGATFICPGNQYDDAAPPVLE